MSTSISFTSERLPRRAIAVIDAIGYAILTCMLFWMLTVLAQNVVDTYRTGEGSGLSAWNPKVWPYRTIYVVGFALFALQSLAKTIENFLIAIGRAPEDIRP